MSAVISGYTALASGKAMLASSDNTQLLVPACLAQRLINVELNGEARWDQVRLTKFQ
jgi:hypothetical protein